ncbi:hypothetical protein [Alishewanella jeotgali]|uniref:Uncharacterized protein n=1 Tax=Alishewanella jeotgali KCTC 22429 TaxID=1129374 RepID=H3Z9R3_9ALTE|nr:hypothetical protein [Alishewanella jeotgali]EHR42587.1 hypothetical protein AJE_00320 [Alishewanella jeotgali KCTC 22429]
MVTIALERISNFLLLPTIAAEEDYVLTQGQDELSWFVLTAAYNTQILQQLADQLANEDQSRLLLMMQGTFLPLERQGNLLLLPQLVCNEDRRAQFYLKVAPNK